MKSQYFLNHPFVLKWTAIKHDFSFVALNRTNMLLRFLLLFNVSDVILSDLSLLNNFLSRNFEILSLR